jgi:hypothetical protein
MVSRTSETAGSVTRLKGREINAEFGRGSFLQSDYLEGRGDERSVCWWLVGKWNINMGGGWKLLGHNSNPVPSVCMAMSALLLACCVELHKARTETACYLHCCAGGQHSVEGVSWLQPMPNGYSSRNVQRNAVHRGIVEVKLHPV